MTYHQEKALLTARHAKADYECAMRAITEKLGTIEDKIYDCLIYDDLREMRNRLDSLCDEAQNAIDAIDDYIDAMAEYEDAEEENEPDSIESLGLQGMF